ncbi:MAG TPA: hypothetical protein VM942_03535, partial [Acidimicrobiales bacterium]|nr:hypothetical protein [Acidimicrobiales bacterium]
LIEEAVASHYSRLQFPPEFIAEVHRKVAEVTEDEAKASQLLRQHFARELARLDRQEENLLDLAADGDLAPTKVRERLKRIERQRKTIQEQLSKSGTSIEAGAEVLRAALDLLNDLEQLYRRAGPDERHLLNTAIYERLYVYEDRITDQSYRSPFDEVVDAHRDLVGVRTRRGSDAVPSGNNNRKAGLLATALSGGGSSRSAMVELRGLEPLTPCMPCSSRAVRRVPFGTHDNRSVPGWASRPPCSTRVQPSCRCHDVSGQFAGCSPGGTRTLSRFWLRSRLRHQHLDPLPAPQERPSSSRFGAFQAFTLATFGYVAPQAPVVALWAGTL